MHGLHDGNKHKKGLWSDYWGGEGGVVLLNFVFLSVLMLFYVSLFLFGSEFHCLGSVQFFVSFLFCLFIYTHKIRICVIIIQQTSQIVHLWVHF